MRCILGEARWEPSHRKWIQATETWTPRLERRAWDLSDLCTYLSEADPRSLGLPKASVGPQLDVYKGNFQLPIIPRLHILYLNN